MSAWIRSSFCGSGACLEAMRTGPVILVQDSKTPASSGGPLQAWSLGEWDELLGALLAGVPHPGVEPIGGGVRLGLKFPADRHEPLIFDRLEWGAFCNGVIAGEFEPDKLSSGVALELSSPAPALSGGTPEGGATGPVPVKPLSVEGKDGHDPRDPGEPYLPGGAQSAATGAGDNAVRPVPVAASSVVQYMQDRELGMRCGRCNKHTGNNHQGHYWKFCTVTKQMEVFHFCCPGDCGRATAWKEQYQKLVDRFAELGIAVDDRNHYLVPPKNERWVALLAAAKAMDDPKSAEPSYVLDREAVLELVERYGAARIKVDRSYFRDHAEHRAAKEAADELLDAIRAALTPVPVVEPDPFNAEESTSAAARRFAGELERLMAGLRDRGILPAPDAPVGTAAVDTALMAIDDLMIEGEDLGAVPVDDANEWAKRIAPLVEHNPETPVTSIEVEVTDAERESARAELATSKQATRDMRAEHSPSVACCKGGAAVGYDGAGHDPKCFAVTVGQEYIKDPVERITAFAAIAPEFVRRVEHNPETLADSRPRGAVDRPCGERPVAAGSGEADPVTQAPGAGSAEPKWDPSTNCYCGGPEEIYPHRRGTGRYCKQRAGQS